MERLFLSPMGLPYKVSDTVDMRAWVPARQGPAAR
jgi:hypothetical protein